LFDLDVREQMCVHASERMLIAEDHPVSRWALARGALALVVLVGLVVVGLAF
jgi:hypothetical protein